MSRREQRASFTDPVRLRLLEGDVDELEVGLKTVNRILTGILISTATASVLLVVNIIVQVNS